MAIDDKFKIDVDEFKVEIKKLIKLILVNDEFMDDDRFNLHLKNFLNIGQYPCNCHKFVIQILQSALKNPIL